MSRGFTQSSGRSQAELASAVDELLFRLGIVGPSLLDRSHLIEVLSGIIATSEQRSHRQPIQTHTQKHVETQQTIPFNFHSQNAGHDKGCQEMIAHSINHAKTSQLNVSMDDFVNWYQDYLTHSQGNYEF